MVDNDCSVSITALSESTGRSWSTVQRILTEDLMKQSVRARWVPHKLNDNQKQQRADGAQRLLDDLYGTVVVIDEKWLYANPMPPKKMNRAWTDPGEVTAQNNLGKLLPTRNFTSSCR